MIKITHSVGPRIDIVVSIRANKTVPGIPWIRR
jgi:hypothetical protein